MATETLTQQVLADYRRARKHNDPYYASRQVLDRCARYLANLVADGADAVALEWATDRYRIARRIHLLGNERAAVGTGTDFADMTAREQYWQTGHLAVNR